MNEYEALEALYTVRATTSSDAMSFVTMLFAYLAAAYVVGPNLSRFQVWTITILYTMFITMPINGVLAGLHDIGQMTQPFRDAPPARSDWVRYGYVAVLWLGWLVSLIFMYQTRRAARKATG